LALVGNKIDLHEDEEVNFEDGFALAKEINAVYKNVSAKTGEGIDDLFQYIGKKILNPNLDTNDLLDEEIKQIMKKKLYEKNSNKMKKKLMKYINF